MKFKFEVSATLDIEVEAGDEVAARRKLSEAINLAWFTVQGEDGGAEPVEGVMRITGRTTLTDTLVQDALPPRRSGTGC